MAINSEACATSGTPGTRRGGITLVDVTNPRRPVKLVANFGDITPPSVSAAKTSPEHQTHSVFVWQDGDRAYAVMVDNEEFEDVDIVDITDPRSPVLTKELDVTTLADIGTAFGDAVFLHDMVVKKIRGEPAVDGHNQRPQQRAALQRGKPDRPQRKDPRSPEELGPQTRFFGRGWRYRWAVPGSAGRRRQSGHGSHRRH